MTDFRSFFVILLKTVLINGAGKPRIVTAGTANHANGKSSVNGEMLRQLIVIHETDDHILSDIRETIMKRIQISAVPFGKSELFRKCAVQFFLGVDLCSVNDNFLHKQHLAFQNQSASP